MNWSFGMLCDIRENIYIITARRTRGFPCRFGCGVLLCAVGEVGMFLDIQGLTNVGICI